MKRFYPTNGKAPVPTWLVMPVMYIACPFILAWAFFSAGFHAGWTEMQIEWRSFRRLTTNSADT